MSAIHQFFAQPGLWFNVFSFALAILGATLGVWALWLAYGQLRKTQRAAEAAKDAAERALAEVQSIATIVEIERLSGLCREVTTLLRTDRRLDTVRILHDLRIGLAKARSTREGENLFTPTGEWNTIIAEVAEIQSRLGRFQTTALTDRMIQNFADRIAGIDQRLNELSPKAVEGATHQGG
jgi:CHAD domain-containing protein